MSSVNHIKRISYRQCLNYVTSCADEVAVHLFDEMRILDDYFRGERSCFQVAETLKGEEIPLSANDRLSILDTLQKTFRKL